jgi:hypothetical protein
MVEPEMDDNHLPVTSVIHVDCIFRAAHLIGVYGQHFLPKTLKFHHSLDVFFLFYVNKYIDHHAFEIAF